MKITMKAPRWGTLDGETWFQMQAGDVYENVAPEWGRPLLEAGAIATDLPDGSPDWVPSEHPAPVAPASIKPPAVVAIAPAPQPIAPVPPTAVTTQPAP